MNTFEEKNIFSRSGWGIRNIYREIKKIKKKLNLDNKDINILDWGCGNGEFVGWLRENGYNAYGVDVEFRTDIKNKNCKSNGYEIFSLTDENGKTVFQDKYFHIICSNQVIEHVKNLDTVLREMNRITTIHGIGYHVFPSHRHFVEQHLKMPFIHWFPKNKIREKMVYLYVLFGIEPKWKLEYCFTLRDKARQYFYYSANHTFYREIKLINELCKKNNFIVGYETINHPKLDSYYIIKLIKKFKLTYNLFNFFLLKYFVVELKLKKE